MRNTADPTLEKRFLAKVTKYPGGCWHWTGATDGRGSGVLSVLGENGVRRNVGAHRVSYILAHGEIPDNQHVWRTCGNLHCVNPAHLALVRASDPRRVRAVRGRRSKLTRVQILCLRALKHSGKPYAKLAQLARVAKSTVWRALHG